MAISSYPEGGIYPEWVWTVMSDLGLLVAIVAFISALVWVWNHGPRLLIRYGPKLFTRWGERWAGKRNGGTDEQAH